MAIGPNLLQASGLPLAFPVAANDACGLAAPTPVLDTVIRMHARSLTVMQKEALILSSRTGHVWRLASDEGAYLDGHDHAPPPLAFLSVGLTASWMIELRALARLNGLGLSPRVRVDIFYSMSGSTTQGTMTGRADAIEVTVDPGGPAMGAGLQGLVADAVAASPAAGLLGQRLENRFALAHNGTPLSGLPVPALHTATVPDLGPAFDRIRPCNGDWSGILVHTGRMSPRGGDTTELGGNWLTDGKARAVRLRTLARFDAEGICVVEQHLGNPQGSVFRFLADDRGRAPDPETYLAAGIGFCFMTQFGRYAKAMKRPLAQTALVQDLHLSLPGASGGTGLAGRAAPLETQVILTSDHEDDFARRALAVAEQSCYLHSLCKTPLKPHLRLGRVEPID